GSEPPEAAVAVSAGGLVEKLDLAALTAAALAEPSGRIVVGVVRELDSRWLSDQSQIVTDARIEVQEVVAPADAALDEVVVVVPGGTVGKVSQESEDTARLREGQRLLLFLSAASDGTYRVAGGWQGAQPIEGELVQSWEQMLADAIAEIRARE
ncbi:MAG: hypothetical protein GX557_04705, partial [Chloroflexi bacterium]|nr:hypothetical protein [Chloroflexota bacterium]